MKLVRTPAIAAAGVMAVGTLIGITGAGTAWAANPTPLCTSSNPGSTTLECGYGHGSDPVEMIPPVPTSTKWYYPSETNPYGTIKQAGTGTTLCMQLNAAGGDTVREAACSSSDSEGWQYYYGGSATGNRTEFISQYSIDHGSPELCLSYDQADSILKADPCGNNAWYQEFTS